MNKKFNKSKNRNKNRKTKGRLSKFSKTKKMGGSLPEFLKDPSLIPTYLQKTAKNYGSNFLGNWTFNPITKTWGFIKEGAQGASDLYHTHFSNPPPKNNYDKSFRNLFFEQTNNLNSESNLESNLESESNSEFNSLSDDIELHFASILDYSKKKELNKLLEGVKKIDKKIDNKNYLVYVAITYLFQILIEHINSLKSKNNKESERTLTNLKTQAKNEMFIIGQTLKNKYSHNYSHNITNPLYDIISKYHFYLMTHAQ